MKTSAQDQFAKWAKLRRSVDKGLADLEKLSTLHSTAVSIYRLLTLCRLRNLYGQVRLRAEIQHAVVAPHHRAAVCRRLVVPQAGRVLSSPGLVRSARLVALAAICSRGLRQCGSVADGVQAGHPRRRARFEGPHR